MDEFVVARSGSVEAHDIEWIGYCRVCDLNTGPLTVHKRPAGMGEGSKPIDKTKAPIPVFGGKVSGRQMKSTLWPVPVLRHLTKLRAKGFSSIKQIHHNSPTLQYQTYLAASPPQW